MKKLLGEGADPNTKDHAGWTPLVSDSLTVDSQEFFSWPGDSLTVDSQEFFSTRFCTENSWKIWKFAKQFSEIKSGKIVKSLEIFFKAML